jgi:hypothetical protein
LEEAEDDERNEKGNQEKQEGFATTEYAAAGSGGTHGAIWSDLLVSVGVAPIVASMRANEEERGKCDFH